MPMIQHKKATDLWNAWHASDEVRDQALAWLTKSDQKWTEDDRQLCRLIHSEPDQALAVVFAIMQMTDDPRVHANLAAGPLEEFLGKHGETYLDIIHQLALENHRLREVLNEVWQGSMPKSVWRRIEMLQQRAFS